jgi:hypothetical protein
MKHVRAYFDSWYASGLATLLVSLLAAWLFARWFQPDATPALSVPLKICIVAPPVVGLSAWIAGWRAVWRRRFGRSLFNFAFGFGPPVASLMFMFGAAAFQSLFSEAQDPFGRDIVVPPDLKLREPRSANDPDAPDAPPDPAALAQDPEGERLRTSCSGEARDAETAQPLLVQLDVLRRFEKDRAPLLDYLTQSAAWHVAEERGQRYAYRRFLSTQNRWESSLNGFYSRDGCQLRVVIGLDGPVFFDLFEQNGEATKVSSTAGSVAVKTQRNADNGLISSYLVVTSAGPALEIFEESSHEDRSATRHALAMLDAELRAAADGKKPSARMEVSDTLDVVHGMQPGIYLVYARVNPGAPGTTYLKLYEHTRNTRLSAERIEQRSRQAIGWSADPREGFLYNVEITIYEGDWGVHYPARFELWFKPADGGPERKLREDIFRVEGWQR